MLLSNSRRAAPHVRRCRDVNDRDAARLDSGLDRIEVRHAAHQQAGAAGKQHRGRDFADDDEHLQSAAALQLSTRSRS